MVPPPRFFLSKEGWIRKRRAWMKKKNRPKETKNHFCDWVFIRSIILLQSSGCGLQPPRSTLLPCLEIYHSQPSLPVIHFLAQNPFSHRRSPSSLMLSVSMPWRRMLMAQVSSLNLLSTSIGNLIVRCNRVAGRAESSIHSRVDRPSESFTRTLCVLVSLLRGV